MLKKARGTLVRRMVFISHVTGCTCQLFFVTYTANDIVEQSRAVGYAAYNTNWQVLSHKSNKRIRNAILMIIVRSTRTCSISAGGFFPVSLETFMMVYKFSREMCQINAYPAKLLHLIPSGDEHRGVILHLASQIYRMNLR